MIKSMKKLMIFKTEKKRQKKFIQGLQIVYAILGKVHQTF